MSAAGTVPSGLAQRGRHQKRSELRVGARRRLHPVARAIEVGGDPVAGQVAVVDAGRFGIHQGEPGTVDRQQLLDERVGQRRRAGSLAEHRGRQQILGGGSDVEVECAEVGQCGPGVLPEPVVGLGPQRGLGSAEPDEPFGGDSGEVGDVFWQSGFHP